MIVVDDRDKRRGWTKRDDGGGGDGGGDGGGRLQSTYNIVENACDLNYCVSIIYRLTSDEYPDAEATTAIFVIKGNFEKRAILGRRRRSVRLVRAPLHISLVSRGRAI